MGDARFVFIGWIWWSFVSIFAFFAGLGAGIFFVLESVLEQRRRFVCILEGYSKEEK